MAVDTSVRMRFAVPADAEPMVRYHERCWYRSFAAIVSAEVMAFIESQPLESRITLWHERMAEGSGCTTVVAIDDDDRPIGHVMVQGDELVHLFIDPDHHGQGLGRVLLGVGERLIGQAGHDVAELHTIVGNGPAIALYEKHGWVVTDETLDEVLPNGSSYTEHVLRKQLGGARHVQANRTSWDDDASNWVEPGRRSWAAAPRWGEMGVPEAQVAALPELTGRDVVELGCGTAYVSAWCLRRGARRVVGLDNSLAQLRTAQRLQVEFELAFPLVWADAERAPFADGSFDVVINEYGAALWCDPHVWIPEAARLLRPGGSLRFLTMSTLLSLAAPSFEHQKTSTRLLRPQRELHRVLFPDTDGVEFALGHGDWIELLTANGFVVDRLIELYAPDDGPDRYSYYDASWARQWPPEEMWCATYTG